MPTQKPHVSDQSAGSAKHTPIGCIPGSIICLSPFSFTCDRASPRRERPGSWQLRVLRALLQPSTPLQLLQFVDAAVCSTVNEDDDSSQSECRKKPCCNDDSIRRRIVLGLLGYQRCIKCDQGSKHDLQPADFLFNPIYLRHDQSLFRMLRVIPNS